MTLIIGMAVLGAIAMVVIWAPAYPEPERDPHMRAMDALAADWAALVARLNGPTTWCATCAQPTTDDRLWCGDECQQEWLS